MAKRKTTPAERERSDSTLDMLGLTREEFRERVINQAVLNLTGEYADPDENSYFQTQIRTTTAESVKAAIDAYLTKHVSPLARQMVETMKFPQTNTYGEPRGEPLTLLEYAAKTAGNWLEEMVDSRGKGKRDGETYGLNQKRGVFLVHEHLHYMINQSITKAVANANAQIAEGIEASVKTALTETLAKLKVEARTR